MICPTENIQNNHERSKQTLSRSKKNAEYKKGRRKICWTKEEDEKIFTLYKLHGTAWSAIEKQFPGRRENQIKNRFYSTLRRVATKKMLEENLPYKSSILMGKLELIKYVDDALKCGHDCFSRRGRKKHPRASKNRRNPKKNHADMQSHKNLGPVELAIARPQPFYQKSPYTFPIEQHSFLQQNYLQVSRPIFPEIPTMPSDFYNEMNNARLSGGVSRNLSLYSTMYPMQREYCYVPVVDYPTLLVNNNYQNLG